MSESTDLGLRSNHLEVEFIWIPVRGLLAQTLEDLFLLLVVRRSELVILLLLKQAIPSPCSWLPSFLVGTLKVFNERHLAPDANLGFFRCLQKLKKRFSFHFPFHFNCAENVQVTTFSETMLPAFFKWIYPGLANWREK